MNVIKCLLCIFTQTKRLTLIVLLLAGSVVGVVAVIGFEMSMAATNTEAFCSSCHLQPGATVDSYYTSSHFKNKTGVQASCADCHVPIEFGNKLWRKVMATKELWSHLNGELDTTEQYLDMVLTMREKEIARLKANDSQECRNCHQVAQMQLSLQTQQAQEFHQTMLAEGKTCIDCHQGLAHMSPRVMEKMTNAEPLPADTQ